MSALRALCGSSPFNKTAGNKVSNWIVSTNELVNNNPEALITLAAGLAGSGLGGFRNKKQKGSFRRGALRGGLSGLGVAGGAFGGLRLGGLAGSLLGSYLGRNSDADTAAAISNLGSVSGGLLGLFGGGLAGSGIGGLLGNRLVGSPEYERSVREAKANRKPTRRYEDRYKGKKVRRYEDRYSDKPLINYEDL